MTNVTGNLLQKAGVQKGQIFYDKNTIKIHFRGGTER